MRTRAPKAGPERPPTAPHGWGIERQGAIRQHRRRHAAPSADDRTHACELRTSRIFEDVIVLRAVEASNPVSGGVAGGDDENRHDVADNADDGEDIDAMDLRQAQIQP
jgi:hypothetical protein